MSLRGLGGPAEKAMNLRSGGEYRWGLGANPPGDFMYGDHDV
jgi:hypothetical protein